MSYAGTRKNSKRRCGNFRKSCDVSSRRVRQNFKRAFRGVLTARNRGHQQNFISIAKSVSIPAEEADIFFVDIYVQETPHLAGFVAEMRLEIGELLIEG